MKNWSEEAQIVAYIVFAVSVLLFMGVRGCIVQERSDKQACVDRGGVPQLVPGNPNWQCVFPPAPVGAVTPR